MAFKVCDGIDQLAQSSVDWHPSAGLIWVTGLLLAGIILAFLPNSWRGGGE